MAGSHLQHLGLPWWKVWWSYVQDVLIEETSSEYNEALYVILSKGRLQLCTPTAIYSWADRYDNFRKLYTTVQWQKISSEAEVLILGFGLGSIPYILEHSLGLHYRYTGIEIDEAVLELASHYTIPQLSSPVALIQSDASVFAEVDDNQYDHIAVDVFIDQSVPSALLTESFMTSCADRLRPKGFLVMNMIALNPTLLRDGMTYFDTVFKVVFPQATYLQIKGNLMLVSDEGVLD